MSHPSSLEKWKDNTPFSHKYEKSLINTCNLLINMKNIAKTALRFIHYFICQENFYLFFEKLLSIALKLSILRVWHRKATNENTIQGGVT